jgi:23S rRNA (pseudouridine1915-N3)-methyltransferase
VKLAIHAVGKLKAGPERDLAARYLDRLARVGPSLGLEFSGVTEEPESRAQTAAERMREEGARLKASLAEDAALILLDERGAALSSQDFASELAGMRDRGCRSLVLAIGGAYGHDASLRAGAARTLSFGAATWPHQLVRIMLAEQLYRAATILSGHPYHRA